jgi:glycosyltransferase involved in cell wall biosynthesis
MPYAIALQTTVYHNCLIIQGFWGIMKEIVKLFVPVRVRNFIRWSYRRAKARIEIALWTLLGRPLYSIVIPCHNVDKYIDDLLQSIFDQIGTSRQFEIIAVDDGSSDQTFQVIKNWEVKFQGVLRVIQFERNMGVSAARNRGMQKSRGLWVTFPDGDDILGEGYILKSVKTIRELDYLNLLIVQCELHFYREEWELTEDTHPLRSKFNTPKPIKVKNLGNRFMMHITTCWVKKKYVTQSELYFNEKLKISEDATLIGELCLLYPEAHIKFLKGAVYLYRKRQDKTSTLDTSTRNVSWLIDPLEQFMIFLLEHQAVGSQRPPTWLQHKILYDLTWKIRALTEDEAFAAHVDSVAKDKVFALLQRVFKSIDESVIMSHNVVMRKREKLGILKMFYYSTLLDPPVYFIKKYNQSGSAFLHYEAYGPEPVTASAKSGLVEIVHQKNREIFLLGKVFLRAITTFVEHPFYGSVQFRDSRGKVLPIYTQSGKLLTKDSLRVADLAPQSDSGSSASSGVMNSNNSLDLLLMDRVDQARDNGEALYRHISKHHPNIQMGFVISRYSSDWKRLSLDGFNLIEYQSRAHKFALSSSKIFASSAIDHHILHPPGFRDLQPIHGKFVFLQHGVIKDDLSDWLNPKTVSLFITSTKQEYLSITDASSPYAFLPSQVIRTGMPRWDRLRKMSELSSKRDLLVIAPTWRKEMVRQIEFRSQISPRYSQSSFFTAWREAILLITKSQILAKDGLEIFVLDHPAFASSKDGSIGSASIRSVDNSKSVDYAEILSRARVLITDYSSLAFDAAASGADIIYFQFDKQHFFSGAHTYRKGYFDYDRDGFGPVAASPGDLLDHLTNVLASTSPREFKNRVDRHFDLFDGSASERVAQAIFRLLDLGAYLGHVKR